MLYFCTYRVVYLCIINTSIMKHQPINIRVDNGTDVIAQAPLIMSASRATDIPAFYTDWFFRRLEKGYVRWRNPFSGQDSYVSFGHTRFIVFWSKNPAPLLPQLSTLKERGIGCYIQYTLNDYEAEGLEPNLPPLTQRIDTFRRLVDALGPGAVVWRFDPLILRDRLNIDSLLQKIARISDALVGCTEKLIFSFADIESYKKVSRNLRHSGINYREWDETTMREFASRLSMLNRDNWNFRLATCAERIDLSEYGMGHNRCIDPGLISRLSPDDSVLQNFLYNARTDSGQRRACGCILSKDIGAYNTCPHGCLYCYANTSSALAFANYEKSIANLLTDSII